MYRTLNFVILVVGTRFGVPSSPSGKIMKNKVLKAMPQVFSLNANSDYSRFVVRGGAAGMMHDTWVSVGKRLNNSMNKVAADVDKKQVTKG
jgi:hypothetical protein